MTLPSHIRIFFAVDLPISIKKELALCLKPVKMALKHTKIKWQPIENLHVTLQFVPLFRTQDLLMLKSKVKKSLSKLSLMPTTFDLKNFELFPTSTHPKFLSFTIAPPDILTDLSRLLRETVEQLNYHLDNRPYRAHLTLGKIQFLEPTEWSTLTTFYFPSLKPIEIKEVVLFMSEPNKTGSCYHVIEKFPLGPI